MFLTLLLGLIVGIVTTRLFYSDALRRGDRDAMTVAWLDHMMIHKQGWTRGHGSYRYVSFDSGKTWYTYEIDEADPIKTDNGYVAQHGYKNIQPATDTDAKIISQADGMSRLMDFVGRNGAVNPTTPEGVTLLKDAGFTVERK